MRADASGSPATSTRSSPSPASNAVESEEISSESSARRTWRPMRRGKERKRKRKIFLRVKKSGAPPPPDAAPAAEARRPRKSLFTFEETLLSLDFQNVTGRRDVPEEAEPPPLRALCRERGDLPRRDRRGGARLRRAPRAARRARSRASRGARDVPSSGQRSVPAAEKRRRRTSWISVAEPTVDRAERAGAFCSIAIAGRTCVISSTSGRSRRSRYCRAYVDIDSTKRRCPSA